MAGKWGGRAGPEGVMAAEKAGKPRAAMSWWGEQGRRMTCKVVASEALD